MSKFLKFCGVISIITGIVQIISIIGMPAGIYSIISSVLFFSIARILDTVEENKRSLEKNNEMLVSIKNSMESCGKEYKSSISETSSTTNSSSKPETVRDTKDVKKVDNNILKKKEIKVNNSILLNKSQFSILSEEDKQAYKTKITDKLNLETDESIKQQYYQNLIDLGYLYYGKFLK